MSAHPDIRNAATVALLRDGDAGLEVLLLRRHGDHVFGANAYVFPGGAVDRQDGADELAARTLSGSDYATACLGDAGQPAAFWTAAIRECFEEAGVLVACDCAHLERERVRAAREALNGQRLDWPGVIATLDLRFRLESLVYFAHWTTPPGPPRRFSTRFFAARAPFGQVAECDGLETTYAWWATPNAALAAGERGDIHLMTPTRATLAQMRGYANTASALAHLPTTTQGPSE